MKTAPDVRDVDAEIASCLVMAKAALARANSLRPNRIRLEALPSHCIREALRRQMGHLLLLCSELSRPAARYAHRHFEREFWCCAALWCRVIEDSTLVLP